MTTVTVLGAGMMGSALCVPLIDRGHHVHLVGTHLDREIITRLKHDAFHLKLKATIDTKIQFYHLDDLSIAMSDADMIAVGVNSEGWNWACQQLEPFADAERPIFAITKGLDYHEGATKNGGSGGFRFLPDVMSEHLLARTGVHVQPASVVGPCIAGELLQRVETCVAISGRNQAHVATVAAAIRTDYYHVWTSPDLEGNAACAALKNGFAMAVGFARGVHEARGGEPGSVAMHNYEAAVFAQAAREMAHLVTLVGGRPETAAGLAGVGDLIVTCQGGRTSRFGRWLGLGLSVDEAIEKMDGATLECLEIIALLSRVFAPNRPPFSLDDFPLLSHLIDLSEGRCTVAVPFDRFFKGAP